MPQITSLASFGHDFQTKIFKCLIEDKVYGASITQMLKQSYFAQDKFKLLLRKVKQYYGQYNAMPNYPTLKILANSVEDKQQIPTVLDLLNKMQQDHSADQLAFVKKQSLSFCRNQQMRDAILDSVDMLNKNDIDSIWDRMNKVLKLSMDGDIGLDINRDYDYITYRENRKTLSTGYALLDQVFNGGIGRGQLAAVMAPTGGGKSQFLVNIRKGALMQGKVVIYYSLQLAQKMIGARLASLISGVPINSIHQKKEQVIRQIKQFFHSTNGKFITKQYPTKSIGPSIIRGHIHKLRANGINPNLVIIDYADLLKPIKNVRQKRTQLQDIYQALRQLAGVQNCTIWTATQTNRSALQMQIINAGMISESFGKLFVADAVISISRTTQDKIAGMGKLHIVKNRIGPQGQTFSMTIDTTRCLFAIDRKLAADQCGGDSNKIMDDFKAERQQKAKTKMQAQLKSFLQKKDKEKRGGKG